MSEIQIVQYNCGNSNGGATRALFDSFTQPLIIAIQEPGYNKYTRSTYCPKPYQLAYEAAPTTGVCFMIRRDVPESHWRRTQHAPNVASLYLQTDTTTITIINVYSRRDLGPTVKEWPRVAQALALAEGEVLLLGDFNVHHPQWGGVGVAYEQQGDPLLAA